jgi:dTDP-4-amino-4,6-dideoxygalactose transaminase
MIPVTKTFLPPIEEYQSQIKEIWETSQLTNAGKLLCDLEVAIKKFLNVTNVILTANGTLSLQIALRVLANKGEIITTPFSYVATTSSIVWEHCMPIFVDIDPYYLTIDESKIEATITSKTTAILATHVFGNPCNIEVITSIAKKYNLKVIYDAAHCFGMKYLGDSIFQYGDISICSFHATKLFHTGEGGAMFCKDEILNTKLNYSHNFGHNGELNYHGLGINAKMNELQAGMGLAVLPYLDDLILRRKIIVKRYDENLNFNKFRRIKIREGTEWNFSYYPIIFENEVDLLKVNKALNERSIYPRRYFYPSLNELNYIKYTKMPVSELVAKSILCLPIYHTLLAEEQELICQIINKTLF